MFYFNNLLIYRLCNTVFGPNCVSREQHYQKRTLNCTLNAWLTEFYEWTMFTDCPSFTWAGLLPDSVSCYVGDSCDSVLCCIDVPLLKRSLSMSLSIDPCTLMATVAVEKYQQTFSVQPSIYERKQHLNFFDVVNVG